MKVILFNNHKSMSFFKIYVWNKYFQHTNNNILVYNLLLFTVWFKSKKEVHRCKYGSLQKKYSLFYFCLCLSFTQDIMGKRASISYQVLNLNIMWNKANYITFCNNFSIYDKTLASWRPITFGTEKIFVFTILVTWDKIIFCHRFSVPKEFFLKRYWK